MHQIFVDHDPSAAIISIQASFDVINVTTEGVSADTLESLFETFHRQNFFGIKAEMILLFRSSLMELAQTDQIDLGR